MQTATPPTDSSAAGAMRFGWFDGIAEGVSDDAHGMGVAVEALNDLGLAPFTLGSENGGRVSLLADDCPLDGERFAKALGGPLRQCMEDVAAKFTPGTTVESTLRCTEVYRDHARETVFVFSASSLRMVSRKRPLRDDDLRRTAPPAQTAMPAPRKATIAAVIALLLVAGGLWAWQSGVIDQLLATRNEIPQTDHGVFNGLVSASAKRSWLDYEVRIRRGATYPDNATAVAELSKSADATVRRAAVNLTADGGTLFVRLEDANGATLVAREVSLRALLAKVDGEVICQFPALTRGTRITLSVDAGTPPK